MSRSTWDIARICLNGHVLTSHLSEHPDTGNYCKRCGAKAIDHCPMCDAPVKGEPFNHYSLKFDPPRFCDNCGAPYPWANKVDEILAEKWVKRTSLYRWFLFVKSKLSVGFTRLRKHHWTLGEILTIISILIAILGPLLSWLIIGW